MECWSWIQVFLSLSTVQEWSRLASAFQLWFWQFALFKFSVVEVECVKFKFKLGEKLIVKLSQNISRQVVLIPIVIITTKIIQKFVVELAVKEC